MKRDLFGRAALTEDPAIIDQLVASYRPAYEKCMFNQTHLYDGIDAMLVRLSDAGLPLAVLSNKPDEFVVPMCCSLLREGSEGKGTDIRRYKLAIILLLGVFVDVGA